MSIRRTTYGLEGLYLSDISGAGIPGCSWLRLGVNLEGTFTMAQDDTEETEINIEESDSPIVQILKAGKKSFTTTIPDLSYDILNKLFGAYKVEGVATEGGTVTRVFIPDSAAYIFKSFKIVPVNGVEQIYFPNGQISAKVAGNLTKDSTLNVELTVTALTPDNDNETAMIIDQVEGDRPGYWLGKTLAEDAFDNLTLIADGAFDLTVDNNALASVSAVSLTGVTDWESMVAKLNSVTTYATWSFNSEEFRFTLTSDNNAPTSANPSTIVIAAPSGGGTDLTLAGMLAMAGGTPVAGY